MEINKDLLLFNQKDYQKNTLEYIQLLEWSLMECWARLIQVAGQLKHQMKML